jgi:hypothetical protein
MAENPAATIAPKSPIQDVLESLPVESPTPSVGSEKKALFDSIAKDHVDPVMEGPNSALTGVFTGLLWFGYAVAIVVALALVWSAANGLLKSAPR